MTDTAQRRPIAALLALVVHEDRILLVRRANAPDAGRLGFPGGRIEWGEPLLGAAERELTEETAIRAEATQVITAVDAFDRTPGDMLKQHFVLIGVLCRWLSGKPEAGDDALEAAWFTLEDLRHGELAVSLDVPEVASLAFREAPHRV